mmetsp:Transcript_18578/g.34417  ORF Transcript_18578/g.34417 Transcript_18578/m.34417 type:complete len:145 (+) Transcript_18578:480-914(+)
MNFDTKQELTMLSSAIQADAGGETIREQVSSLENNVITDALRHPFETIALLGGISDKEKLEGGADLDASPQDLDEQTQTYRLLQETAREAGQDVSSDIAANNSNSAVAELVAWCGDEECARDILQSCGNDLAKAKSMLGISSTD